MKGRREWVSMPLRELFPFITSEIDYNGKYLPIMDKWLGLKGELKLSDLQHISSQAFGDTGSTWRLFRDR
jgi:hypothetical protein